jgi:hypothetical protein
MTPRELREALFYIQNQEMTVKELRAKLFDIEDQDMELVPGFCMWIEMEEANAPASDKIWDNAPL